MEDTTPKSDALQGKLGRRMVDVYHPKKIVLRVKKNGTSEANVARPERRRCMTSPHDRLSKNHGQASLSSKDTTMSGGTPRNSHTLSRSSSVMR